MAAGADPRGTIKNDRLHLVFEGLGLLLFVAVDLDAAATSFSPTCRLSLYRPRIRLVQPSRP
jgi:hypothetical protein